MKMTKEQLLEKEKWKQSLKSEYSRSVALFCRDQIFDMPEDAFTIITAYGIDREAIFYECVEEFMEARQKAFDNRPNPNQHELFEQTEQGAGAHSK